MSLHRLVYYSRNRVADLATLPTTVEQILSISPRNNAAVSVTGALMFNTGCFAQVLEGKKDAVEATFERIQQDERHGEVLLLALDEVDRRVFGGWSMGYVGASHQGARNFAGVAANSGFDLSVITGEVLFNLLHNLALEEEAQAA